MQAQSLGILHMQAQSLAHASAVTRTRSLLCGGTIAVVATVRMRLVHNCYRDRAL